MVSLDGNVAFVVKLSFGQIQSCVAVNWEGSGAVFGSGGGAGASYLWRFYSGRAFYKFGDY